MKMYYTDPLRAALMAREFGVKFNFEEMRQDYESGGLKAKRSLKKIKSWKTIIEIGKHCDKFYIHPDSLALFEPREGDMIIEYDDNEIRQCFLRLNSEQTPAAPYKIIQRDNKAFFMPEVEA